MARFPFDAQPLARQFPHEQRRLIEIDDAARPLVDAMQALDASLVTLAGRLLDGGSIDEMHVLAAFTRRAQATAFLKRLIDLAPASTTLRKSLTDMGQPQITEIGARHFVWWPALKGYPQTKH